MFIGAHAYRVDDKGRTKLPAAFTSRLGPSFVLTRGTEGCLWLLPREEWERLVARLASDSLTDSRIHALQRVFIGNGLETSLDGQGRLFLPAHLREYAKIVDEIMVVGVGNRVEIWARAQWAEYNRRLDDAAIAELGRGAGL